MFTDELQGNQPTENDNEKIVERLEECRKNDGILITMFVQGEEVSIELPPLVVSLLMRNIIPRLNGGASVTPGGKFSDLLKKLITDVIRTQMDLGM